MDHHARHTLHFLMSPCLPHHLPRGLLSPPESSSLVPKASQTQGIQQTTLCPQPAPSSKSPFIWKYSTDQWVPGDFLWGHCSFSVYSKALTSHRCPTLQFFSVPPPVSSPGVIIPLGDRQEAVPSKTSPLPICAHHHSLTRARGKTATHGSGHVLMPKCPFMLWDKVSNLPNWMTSIAPSPA